MATTRFHVSNLAGIKHPAEVPLPPEEGHHAHHVLRLNTGDSVELFDGKGNYCTGIIVRISKKETVVQTSSFISSSYVPRIYLAIYTALPRTHRQQFLFEKCTETCVAEIQPLVTERSVVKPKPNAESKWHRFSIEAAKQSGTRHLPIIHPPLSIDKALKNTTVAHESWLLDPAENADTILDRLSRMDEMNSRVIAWIGPEGGFSEKEKDLLKNSGAIPVKLGPSILRIETAAISVASIVSAWNAQGKIESEK